jgi:hypothetical protein
MRPALRALFVLLTALPSLALADLTAEQAGQLQADMEEREAAIKKELGGKEPSKMTREEQNTYGAKVRAARDEVLIKNGTSSKEYERSTMRMGREAQGERAAAKKAYQEKKTEDAKKAAAVPPKGEAKIEIQRGFDDKNPVMLESKGAAPGAPAATPAPAAGPAKGK